MNNIVRECMETPRKYECDVCVCGGGFAGVAAAASAARAGAKVILLERGFMLGGLGTAGLVTIYLALCDGKGHQVAFGLAEELFKLSIQYGAEDKYPKPWLENGTKEEKAQTRFEVQYNPYLCAIAMEQLLIKEGVTILYGATAAGTAVEKGKITDIIIEGKSGREAIKINKSVVDATGDADICALSGAKTAIYSAGNIPASWYYGYGNQEYKLYMCGATGDSDLESAGANCITNRRYGGLDTQENSEIVQMCHGNIIKDMLKRRAEGITDLLPVNVGTIPQLRMTRRLVGAYEMDITEDSKAFEDSVGTFPAWNRRGPVYELPLSTLYGKEIRNLITAGRCISSTDKMWNVTRVIPVCAVTGEAAGAAAALSDDFANRNVKALQDLLAERGVKIHLSEICFD